MSPDWRGIAVFLVLLAAAAGSWYLLNVSAQAPDLPPPPGEHVGSYYLRGASITGLDNSGAVLYELNADLIEHDASDDSIALKVVRMDYQATPASSWIVEAEDGQVDGNRTVIELSGSVTAQRSREADAPLILSTDVLRLETETSVASTSDRVRVEVDGKFLSGTGMHVDLKQEKLRLESNVHGRFTD